jgi:3-methyl-2-oxobutanoate hydroxymethyltransferase
MAKLTVKELLELKGVRQITFVQVARAEEAIAASLAGMDMIGTGFRAETRHFRELVPDLRNFAMLNPEFVPVV